MQERRKSSPAPAPPRKAEAPRLGPLQEAKITAETPIAGRDVRFAGAAGLLTGTLQLPPEAEEPWAAVLFLHGSGPQDRNQNNPRAPLNIFNTLAADLTRAGIASLRYDKRGIGESTGDAMAASIADFAADAHLAVRFLRRSHETAGLPVFVLGHSEGATIALMLTGRDPAIAGAILLCPTITPMDEVLRRQAVGVQAAIDRLPPEQRRSMGIPDGFNQMQATDQMIAAIRSTPENQAAITFMNQPVPARWFRSHFDLDHAAILEQVHAPVLAIGGTKDTQVPPGDAEAIVAALRRAGAAAGGEIDAMGVTVPDLTHVLRRSTGDGGVQEYAELVKQPVDPGLRGLIVEWLQRHRPDDVEDDQEAEGEDGSEA